MKRTYPPHDLLEKVMEHMSWSREKAVSWFDSKNPLFANLSPMQYLFMRPEKARKAIESMIEENSVSKERE